MPQTDLILLHPPSVYDFRQKTILYGPISDLVPSTHIFEMYPIGITSIAEYLERAGHRVRIVNVAVRMLQNNNFDVDKLIKGLNAPVFGIDLHWLPHAQGAIEIARLVKRYHPNAKVIMGGLSASYFYRELLDYPEVDYVVRGDTTEDPICQLMDYLKGKGDITKIPNLAWRDEQGHVQKTEFSHAPTDLNNIMVHYYDNTVKSILRYRDMSNYLPFQRWLKYPVTAVLTCRGCTQNCVICGGSAFAYRNSFNRETTAYRNPQAVARDVNRIAKYSKGPIFILGDIRQPGEDYAHELLYLLKKEHVKNQFILELFSPASKEFLNEMGQACPNFCLEMSPESHDFEVRKASGKPYSTQDMNNTFRYALDAGCGRMDIFFMIGVPKQTTQSVMGTIDYSQSLMKEFKGDKRLSCFISPLAPFLDPGSLGFEKSEKHGYHVLFRTLEEHRQALLAPSWKHTLNYETDCMTRDQIVDISYEAGLRLNRLKAQHNLISKDVASQVEQRIESALEVLHRIDDIVASGNGEGQLEELAKLKPVVDSVSMSTVCEKRELELPVSRLGIRPLHSAWAWLVDRK